MLRFDDHFASYGARGCALWAGEPAIDRVRFNIGHKILREVLHGGKPGRHDADFALCERERSRIETACRRAFASRPGARISLRKADFNE
jgi:hypothetical protein